MGFLKKSNAPSELPDLAIDSLGVNVASVAESKPITAQPLPVVKKPVVAPIVAPVETKKEPIAEEDSLEVSHDEAINNSTHNNIKKVINETLPKNDNENLSRHGFFDQILDDINVELKDVGKLGDWYENKFAKENIVSNMKGYWEGNKANIIIESFGAEYKRQINDKVKVLQELEEDWREIYFRLVKKEEEMKKEERGLKDTLSEFVNLCKRRNYGCEKEKENCEKENE